MEADWAAEVGPGLPVIEADWPGRVDLRSDPKSVDRIPETLTHPALREALLRLNVAESPVRTAKCDVWTLAGEEIDPLEFGCEPGGDLVGVACYIDLVAVDPALFASFERQESWAQAAVQEMRRTPAGPGRVDLVIRAARRDDGAGFGITLYVAGCGADTATAQATWAVALHIAAAVTMRAAPALPGE